MRASYKTLDNEKENKTYLPILNFALQREKRVKFALRICPIDVKDIPKAVSEHGNRDVCVVKKTVQGRGRVAFVMAKFLQMVS